MGGVIIGGLRFANPPYELLMEYGNNWMMDYFELSKIITAIVVALVTVLGRYAYYRLSNSLERLKIRTSTAELLHKVLNESNWKKLENRVVVEEVFEQLFTKPLDFYEINMLLTAKTPHSAFRTYLNYRSVLEFNKRKTKIKFKENKYPYWVFANKKVKVPRIVVIGVGKYFVAAMFATVGLNWLISDEAANISLIHFYLLWFVDVLLWIIAVVYLLEGIKYQAAEEAIVANLSDKYEKRG